MLSLKQSNTKLYIKHDALINNCNTIFEKFSERYDY